MVLERGLVLAQGLELEKVQGLELEKVQALVLVKELAQELVRVKDLVRVLALAQVQGKEPERELVQA